MRIPKRFSLAALMAAVTAICLMLAYVSQRLELRRVESVSAKNLVHAGVNSDDISWGTDEDIIELEDPQSKFSTLMTSAEMDNEATVRRLDRLLSERVVGIDEIKNISIGGREFFDVKSFRVLVWLEITNCTIDRLVLQEERLPQTLKRLSVCNTSLSGMQPLFLDHNTLLEILILSDCDVTDSVLQSVGELTRLRELDLSYNEGITDRGVEQLRCLTNLLINA